MGSISRSTIYDLLRRVFREVRVASEARYGMVIDGVGVRVGGIWLVWSAGILILGGVALETSSG